mmetsp:Transcript_3511/g.10227  ORF Transcript_3511/g.10227 Transcript_3511/m.10227 type:complete len:281 (+) Transcript_3511:719-1561(+)
MRRSPRKPLGLQQAGVADRAIMAGTGRAMNLPSSVLMPACGPAALMTSVQQIVLSSASTFGCAIDGTSLISQPHAQKHGAQPQQSQQGAPLTPQQSPKLQWDMKASQQPGTRAGLCPIHSMPSTSFAIASQSMGLPSSSFGPAALVESRALQWRKRKVLIRITLCEKAVPKMGGHEGGVRTYAAAKPPIPGGATSLWRPPLVRASSRTSKRRFISSLTLSMPTLSYVYDGGPPAAHFLAVSAAPLASRAALQGSESSSHLLVTSRAPATYLKKDLLQLWW